ncbi:MAG: hypothetical protein ABSH20_13900 [Tepidisphaeraceae bacterium]
MPAKQSFAALLGLKSENADALRFLGEAAYLWWYLRNFDKALIIFEAITLLAPNDPVGFLGCAETLLEKGSHKEAERAATQATRTANINRRSMAFAHVLRGQAMFGLNNPGQAEKAWQKASELAPEGEMARNIKAKIEVARVCGLLPQTQAK